MSIDKFRHAKLPKFLGKARTLDIKVLVRVVCGHTGAEYPTAATVEFSTRSSPDVDPVALVRIGQRRNRLNGVDIFPRQSEFTGTGKHACLVAVKGREIGLYVLRLRKVEIGLNDPPATR